MSLGDGLLKLIIQTGSNPYRVIFFKWGPHGRADVLLQEHPEDPQSAHRPCGAAQEDSIQRNGKTSPL